MQLKSALVCVLAGLALVGAIVGVSDVRQRSGTKAAGCATSSDSEEPDTLPEPIETAAAVQSEAVPTPTPSVTASNVSPQPASSTAQDETAIMAKIHELGETDPPLSLKLAREGNARFPAGSGAAERGWIICKSLTNMGRFDEAHEEAKAMVEAYPNTPWATDITRHILINPRNHPSERGHGKKYELE